MRLINVSKNYNDIELLKNINLSFNKNGLVLIQGENGSGKTTFLNIISKLINSDSGKVFLKNDFIYISYDSNFLNEYNVLENFKLISKLHYIEFDKNRCDYYFNYLNLTGVYLLKPCDLSRGELSRVLLVLGLSLNKDIIIIDEITSNLDEENIILVESLLKKEKNNKLIFFISHNNIVTKDIDMILKLESNEILVNNISYDSNADLIDSNYKNSINLNLLYKIIFKSNIYIKSLVANFLISLIFVFMKIEYVKIFSFGINNIKIYGFILILLLLFNHIFEIMKNIKRKIGCFKYIGINCNNFYKIIFYRSIKMIGCIYCISLLINRIIVNSINEILGIIILDYDYFISMDLIYLFIFVLVIYFIMLRNILTYNILNIKQE